MPEKDFLSLEKKQHLQEILQQSQRAEVRERVLILLFLTGIYPCGQEGAVSLG